MRFARHVRIFRGPLDPAPVAAVVLLLLLFMLLGSLLYTPGVLIKIGQPITVKTNNDILFDGKSYPAGDWDQLRSALQALPGDGPFSVKVEPGADPKVAQQVSNLFEITLPDGKYLVGTDNARVVVAVNFRGQCFLENRPVQEAELNVELRRRLQMAARDSRKLTLILWMDKAAEIQVLAHLSALAGQAGIPEVLLLERPALFDGRP
jgi:biopolymer transport protein ExbD